MKQTIPVASPLLGKDEFEAVREVLESGELVQGKRVKLFEEKFSEYICAKHSVAVSNGTTALDLALKTLNLNPKDEVITSAFSFVASANCVLYQGAKPVFADINPKTFNIDPSDVAKKISNRTKAIIPVHLFGQPADMKPLEEIANEHKIVLIEDAAQAHGAEYRKRKVGSIGTIGCFSFYPTKNMTTGEGGVITTNNNSVAEKIRLLRNHGQAYKYHHIILGYNYRMTEISAAIGLVQLMKLDSLNEKRRENAKTLMDGIRGIKWLTAPYVADGVKHVFNQFVVRVEENCPLKRNMLVEHLKNLGIGVSVHYPMPIYKQPLYLERGYGKTNCPRAEDASKHVIGLPVHPAIAKRDIGYILNVLKGIR